MSKAEAFDLSRSEWEHLIDEWIFSERDRAILKRRLLDGIRIEPLAEEFDISVRQMNYIIASGQDRIFSKIKLH
jgi:hypothetical protein